VTCVCVFEARAVSARGEVCGARIIENNEMGLNHGAAEVALETPKGWTSAIGPSRMNAAQ
jgi:hypothetical protein